MAHKTFKNWLLSADKKPLYVDNTTGHVLEADVATWKKPDGQPAHLQHDPTGWKDILVKYARNTKYWGLFRDMTVPMNFAGDGATILRHQMWNYGSEVITWLALQKLDRLSFPYIYKPWYLCEMDFSKFKQTRTTVSVNAMEGGLSKYLKANEATSYELPVNTDVQKKVVYLDGLPFENTIEYNIFSQDVLNSSFVGGHEYWHLGMGIISNDGTTQGILSQDQVLTNYPPYALNNYFNNSVTKNYTLHVTGEINFTAKAHNSRIAISIQKTDSAGTVLTTYDVFLEADVAQDSINNVPFSFDIPMAPGQSVTLNSRTPTETGFINISSGKLIASYQVTFTQSFTECLTPFRVFELLAAKITDGKYGVQSSFLQTVSEELLLTCGQALRKYQATSVLKTSLNDFFQSFRRYGIGLGILRDPINGDKLIIEKLEYFFRSDIAVLNLGEISDLSVDVAEDISFNTIKAGFKNQTIDKVNGRDEFNVTQLYSTPNTRIIKELDLVSTYRADMYGIEVTRIDLFGKDTTDNTADNDVFMISVEKGTDFIYFSGDFECIEDTGSYYIRIPGTQIQLTNGTQFTISGAASNNGTYTIVNTSYLVAGFTTVQVAEAVTDASVNGTITGFNADWYKLNRPAFTTVSGLLHPDESFNIPLSPKRALIENGPLIHSVLDKMDIKSVKFQTGEKNSELSTIIAGETVTEKGDLPIGGLGTKLFLPYYFKFTTKVPINYLELINSNPYGLIYFTYKGITYNGFMWDGGIKPGNNDKQEWQLLCGPNNDLKKLIDNV